MSNMSWLENPTTYKQYQEALAAAENLYEQLRYILHCSEHAILPELELSEVLVQTLRAKERHWRRVCKRQYNSRIEPEIKKQTTTAQNNNNA